MLSPGCKASGLTSRAVAAAAAQVNMKMFGLVEVYRISFNHDKYAGNQRYVNYIGVVSLISNVFPQ